MKVKSIVAVLVSFAAVWLYGADAGSCEAKAVSYSVGKSVSVKLVNEYDSEFGYWDSGVKYFKVTITKGSALTFWITGGNTSDLTFDLYWKESTKEDVWEPLASFDPEEYADGATKVAKLFSESWDEEDPSSWVCYVKISGEIGQTCTLNSANGIISFLQEGEEENPRRITITDTQVKDQRNLIDGDFFYIARMEAGRKYLIRTVMGDVEEPLDVLIDGGNFYFEPAPAYTNDQFNGSYFVYPQETGDYKLQVCSRLPSAKTFKLAYRSYPARKPGDHPTEKLYATNDYTAVAYPGRIIGDDQYYDSVIDEDLFRIKLAAGERWIFNAAGATNSVLMRLYDANGTILAENDTVGNWSYDTRTSVQTTYDGWYYVGVCDPFADYWMERPDREPVEVSAVSADSYGDADAYDPTDDVYTGASPLRPYPGASAESVTKVGQAHGPHAFNGCDWYDWYEVDCRAGQTYVFRTKFAGSETSTLTLKAKVYRLVNGALEKVTANGTLTPDDFDVEGLAPLNFKAEFNGRYYIRVSVAEGLGMDFPEHMMYSMVYGDSSLGLLQVKTKGVEGSWYLTDDSTAVYPNGAVIAVPVGAGVNLRCSDVDGFTTPEKVKGVTVKAWTGDEAKDVTVLTRVYYDIYDPGDDVVEGYFDIAPSATSTKCKRTLWTAATNPVGGDDVDYFRFKAYEGIYYSFWLTDTTQEGVGDAMMTITEKASGATEFEGETSVMKKSFTPGKHYIKVAHGQPPAVDSTYRLYYKSANVGALKFSKDNYTYPVYDTDAYADVTVTRSGSEGVVQVNYATVEGTAVPGTDYYPTRGVLRWEDGDSEPKTIRVRLIPDLRPVNTGTRRFTVKLWPVPEGGLEDDEYMATIVGQDEATVKIKDPTAQDPGEVVLVGPRAVASGSKVTYTLVRKGAVQGRIAVKIKTQPMTALADRDYVHLNQTFVWEDGESGETNLVLTVNEAQDSVKEKQLYFKLSAQTTDAYADCLTPDLPETKIPITIRNEKIVKDLDDVVADAAEVGVALSASGTWYANAMGNLVCDAPAAGGNVKMKFTVTGPGFFIAEPQIENGTGVLRYSCGDSGYVDCSSGDRLVIPVEAAAGNKTLITFKLNGTDGNAFVSFTKQNNGLSFKWVDLESAVAIAPQDQATVSNATEKLGWTRPDGAKDESLWYRVRTKASTTTKQEKCLTVLTNGTEKTECDIPAGFLTAGQTYAWVLDYAISDEADPDFESLDWLTGPAVWHFTTAAEGAKKTVCIGTDVNGDPISSDKPVELVQGVATDIAFNDTGLSGGSLALVSGGIPSGVEMKKATKKRIGGVPSAAGDYTALFQVDDGETLPLTFHVVGLGTGLGDFCGTLKEDGAALTNGFPRVGRMTFYATAAGSLTANAKIGSTTYKFTSAKGYDEVLERKGDRMTVTALLTNTITVNGVTYENTLNLTIHAGPTDELDVLGRVAGEARLTVAVPDADGQGAQQGIEYVCDLYRNHVESEAYGNLMKKFAGYYTVSLVPFGVQPVNGVPCGNGYLTMTVAEDGETQLAGLLADGTAVSASSKTQLVGDLTDLSKCKLCIPFVMRVSPACFGGVIRLDWAERVEDEESVPAVTVDSLEDLEWNKDGEYSSFDRKGFRITISPTGGWYDTVVNLQAYYLYRDFTAETDPIDGLPEELLPAGYSYTPMTTPSGVEVTFASDVMTPATRSLVADEDDPSRYDFSRSVNPWKVKTSFVRATGVLTGTFKAWSDDGITQSQFATYNHYGVVLMNRNEKTSLLKDMNVLTAGFYLAPVTSKWTLSMPFNILWTENERNGWQEAEVPGDEEDEQKSGFMISIF